MPADKGVCVQMNPIGNLRMVGCTKLLLYSKKELRLYRLCRLEILLVSREEDGGGNGPGLHVNDPLDVLTGGAAAVVANAVDLHHIIDAVALAEQRHLV